MPSRVIEPERLERARQLFRQGEKLRDISDAVGIGQGTIYRHLAPDDHEVRARSKTAKSRAESARIAGPAQSIPDAPSAGAAMPMAIHEEETLSLPESEPQSYEPYTIDTPGVWLGLMDVHIPSHDRTTIELAVKHARARNAVGVLLNGDILDSHEISDHDRDPTAPRYVEEIARAKQFLAWLRGQFPRARIVYKSGNHEDRLGRYLLRRAPALFDLPGVDLPSFLDLKTYGVEWVGDSRVITLGRLNVIHGHEYPGGVSSPVNPARGLYLKARSVAMCGHHHRTSEHHARDIRQRAEAAWSVGCACFLHPRWRPLNDWNHGYCLVELDSQREFTVENRRVMGGKVM